MKPYYGQELVIRPRRLAMMNLYLHGLSPNIELGDTIYEPRPVELVSCILTNPPFGTRGADNIPDRDFKVKTTNKQLNFVQHIIQVLELGGRAAIVLPDSVLTEDKATELWEEIMKSNNVHTILILPNGTFLPYANVKAIVIFLETGIPTDEVWIYDGRTNIKSVTKKNRPLNSSHFEEFEKVYGTNPNGKDSRKESLRFKRFSKEEIIKQNYRLDFTWLKEELSSEITEISDPHELALNLIDELEIITDNFKEVIQLLDENE